MGKVIRVDANINNSDAKIPILSVKNLKSENDGEYVGHITFKFQSKDLFFLNSLKQAHTGALITWLDHLTMLGVPTFD